MPFLKKESTDWEAGQAEVISFYKFLGLSRSFRRLPPSMLHPLWKRRCLCCPRFRRRPRSDGRKGARLACLAVNERKSPRGKCRIVAASQNSWERGRRLGRPSLSKIHTRLLPHCCQFDITVMLPFICTLDFDP